MDLPLVSVIRYVRPSDKSDYSKLSNLGGVTFIFTMDYNNRTVEASFAICSSNDNFNKKLGISHASKMEEIRTFDLDKFQQFANDSGGFVDAYLNIIKANDVVGTISANEKMLLRKFSEQKLQRSS